MKTEKQIKAKIKKIYEHKKFKEDLENIDGELELALTKSFMRGKIAGLMWVLWE